MACIPWKETRALFKFKELTERKFRGISLVNVCSPVMKYTVHWHGVLCTGQPAHTGEENFSRYFDSVSSDKLTPEVMNGPDFHAPQRIQPPSRICSFKKGWRLAFQPFLRLETLETQPTIRGDARIRVTFQTGWYVSKWTNTEICHNCSKWSLCGTGILSESPLMLL